MGDLRSGNGGTPDDNGSHSHEPLPDFPAEWGPVIIPDDASELESDRQALVREVLGQAHRNGFGVTGLRRVLRSLEMGEVQTLLLGENFRAHAVECTSCGHLDSHIVRFCPVCGRETREMSDVCDALIPAAIRRDIELFYVKDDPELDRVGNIGALLRFRADQNTPARIVAAS